MAPAETSRKEGASSPGRNHRAERLLQVALSGLSVGVIALLVASSIRLGWAGASLGALALVLAGFGLFAWAHKPEDARARSLLLSMHCLAALLGASFLARRGEIDPFWSELLLLWTACLWLDFHVFALADRRRRPAGWVRALVYASALGLSVAMFWWWDADGPAASQRIIRAYAAACWLASAFLVLRTARAREVVLPAAPVVLLSLVPEALGASIEASYVWTLPFLAALPLTHSVAIRRHDVLPLDRVVDRRVVHRILGWVLALAAFALAAAASDLSGGNRLILGTVVVLIALAFRPIRDLARRLLDRALYGGWYDPRSVVSEMNQALAGIVEAHELASLLVDRLAEILRVRGAALLLPSERGELAVVRAEGFHRLEQEGPLSLRGALAAQLLHAARPFSSAELAAELARASATEAERHWLTHPEIELWVPLVRRGSLGKSIFARLQGALILGGKIGQADYDAEDRRMLATLAWSAAVAAENVELFATLRRRAEEVNRLYSRLVESREEERKRIARELHDRVIQELIDLHYAASRLAAEGEQVRERLRGIIDDIRQVCAELRPSALDDLSLALAIEGHVDDVRRKFGLKISLSLPEAGDEVLETLPEEARLSLFRVLQEALSNVQRHAQARRVEVQIRAGAGTVTLEVRDDGRGFLQPSNFGALIREGRFGLAGAQERMHLVGGRLEIDSVPGQGTILRAELPATAAERPLTAVSHS